jgi:hypothetical protein
MRAFCLPVLLVALTVTWQGAQAATPTLSDLNIDSLSDMKRASAYCAENFEAVFDYEIGSHPNPPLRDLCAKAFVCGGGKCIGNDLTVLVDRSKFEDFRREAARIEGLELEGCPPERGYDYRQDFTVQVFSDIIATAKHFAMFCGVSKPGRVIETVLKLRRDVPGVLAAARWGGDAGLMSAPLDISEATFRRLVASVDDLVPMVQAAFARASGVPCETNDLYVCSVVAINGRVQAELMVPGTSTTGRDGFWEHSVWQFAPSWTGLPGQYWLEVDVPITAYKRWPADSRPSGKFTSVDYDEGFERFRQLVMERLKVAFAS